MEAHNHPARMSGLFRAKPGLIRGSLIIEVLPISELIQSAAA